MSSCGSVQWYASFIRHGVMHQFLSKVQGQLCELNKAHDLWFSSLRKNKICMTGDVGRLSKWAVIFLDFNGHRRKIGREDRPILSKAFCW